MTKKQREEFNKLVSRYQKIKIDLEKDQFKENQRLKNLIKKQENHERWLEETLVKNSTWISDNCIDYIKKVPNIEPHGNNQERFSYTKNVDTRLSKSKDNKENIMDASQGQDIFDTFHRLSVSIPHDYSKIFGNFVGIPNQNANYSDY